MSPHKKQDMYRLLQQGALFVCKTFNFRNGKDKGWEQVNKWKASMKSKGYRDFDEEDGEDYEFIMVKR